jgi:hypothetical protein
VSRELDDLSAQWCDAKADEAIAVARRRTIEDRLVELLALDEGKEGTTNARTEQGYAIKVVGRMNRKVDADKLQELAAEHGLSEHLGSLFRWSADINAAAWKSAAPTITAPLLGAITTTPGRPSFSITAPHKPTDTKKD